MALIKINAERFLKGKLSISRRKEEQELDNNGLPMSIIGIYGVFVTHDYIEEITSIETERYYLDDIDVYQEDFGSNDYNIIYYFKANNFAIKDDYIPEQIKQLIEYELYEEEETQYFHSDNFEDALEKYEELFNSDSEDDY